MNEIISNLYHNKEKTLNFKTPAEMVLKVGSVRLLL